MLDLIKKDHKKWNLECR